MTNERMRMHDDDAVLRGGQRLADKFVLGEYVPNGAGFGSRCGRDVLNSFDIERSGIRDMSDAPTARMDSEKPMTGRRGQHNIPPRADTWYAWRNETPQPKGAAKNAAVDSYATLQNGRSSTR